MRVRFYGIGENYSSGRNNGNVDAQGFVVFICTVRNVKIVF
jgi:hypothetical protein